MFIPLTINQRRDGLQNVLIAGDTAGIFYALAELTSIPLNIFLADTGISRPLREFPCHRGAEADKANVYYDFFDGRIGAGIIRRMDCVITPSNIDYVTEACKAYGIPLSVLKLQSGEVQYNDLNGIVIFRDNDMYISRARDAIKQKPAVTTFSAWDRCGEVLAYGDSVTLNDTTFDYTDERRLIELGIPELDILTVEPRSRHMELSGDVARVFDGLME